MADNIKAELESKRQKLNRIREEKMRRAAAAASTLGTRSIDSSVHTANHSITSIADIDQILKSLGIETPRAADMSAMGNASESRDPDLVVGGAVNHSVEGRRKDQRKLKAIFGALRVDIPPDLRSQVYTKETQTVASDHETNEALQWDDEEMFVVGQHVEPFHAVVVDSLDPSSVPDAAADMLLASTGGVVDHLSADERERLMNSSQLADFLGKSGRALERMLASSATGEAGAFVNYRTCMGDRRFSGEPDEEFADSEDECNKLMRLTHTIHEPGSEEFRGSSINSVDWCKARPELLLAAYGNVNSENGVAGKPSAGAASRVLIWNQRHGGMKSPEFTLNCYQSPVTCSIFSPYHRYLVYGGTYSGQIVIWDLRTGRTGPVQRSLPSGEAHQHPVYALRTVGNSENAYSLISVSSDGKMCTWRPDMVAKPSQDAINLLYKQTINVATTCLDFPAMAGGDITNKFVVGSDEHNIYLGIRHGSGERNAGISAVLEGHRAQVTSVNCHPQSEWSDLLLSSSLDCTVGIWSLSEMAQIASLTSDNNEYVLDVKWARSNPAVLACSSSGGRISIWDLSRNIELPRVSQSIHGGYPAKRLAWQCGPDSIGGGRTHLAVGTEVGSLHLFAVSELITQSRNDTVSRFNLALKDLRSRHHADRG